MRQIIINTRDIFQDFFIGITDNRQATCIQNSGARKIIFDRLAMTVAINLDDKAKFGTIKINNEIRNWFLAQKFVLRKLPHPQNFIPHLLFSGSWVVAILARKRGKVFVVGQKTNPS